MSCNLSSTEPLMNEVSKRSIQSLKVCNVSVNYEDDSSRLREFMLGFKDSNGSSVYMDAISQISSGSESLFHLHVDHLFSFEQATDLSERIVKNTAHYVELISRIVDGFLPEIVRDRSATSIVTAHRLERIKEKNPEDNVRTLLPAALLRSYTVVVHPPAGTEVLSVRDVASRYLGKLIKTEGIVVRVTEVKPLIAVANYLCDKCGHEIYQEVLSECFMPLGECPSEDCKKKGIKGSLVMQTRGSKFKKFQELRIQECMEHVPVGSIPSTHTVFAYDDLTRQCLPGDRVVVTGVYLPKPYTGFKKVVMGLLTDSYVLAMEIEQCKRRFAFGLVPSVVSHLQSLCAREHAYDRLASSIAPEVYGNLDVKKLLLLTLVGGTSKVTEDGTRMRGNVNLCLMGDPGVAKSQLLKYTARLCPRGVYTTGKGSSGVGLTAAVTKDSVTGEMVLEGGALVLSDNGVCCIDEFDKMDEKDRAAIYEVMEQQGISISKAGITTTLNARTSIIAAANPANGKYNENRSVYRNVNLPYALLSRFDVMFVLRDLRDPAEDARLAEHVTWVHRYGTPQPVVDDYVEIDVLRQYVSYAKGVDPVIPESLRPAIVDRYTAMRQNSGEEYVTARTLMAIIRLSQARAKLSLRDVVQLSDVSEAVRLLEASKQSALRGPVNEVHTSYLDGIYALIVTRCGDAQEAELAPLRQAALQSGYTSEQFSECIATYDSLGMWSVSSDGTKIVML